MSAARGGICSCAAWPTRSREVVTNPNPANAAFVIREFSIVTRDAAGNVTGVQNPYAEVDFKTSGGHDSYNAMMLPLNRRSAQGLALNMQYTLGKSHGTSGGANGANTAANNARTDSAVRVRRRLQQLRRPPHLQPQPAVLAALRQGTAVRERSNGLPTRLLGGWDVGGIVNARSGVPVNVLVDRPDILYRDTATGLYYTGPAVGRTAVINTPGGGASRNVRRPDLVPGVDPFVKDGGLMFLNPAAFATPQPGTFGNMERNSVHGPSFKQVDFFFAKHFRLGGRSEHRVPRRGLQPVQHHELLQPGWHAERRHPDDPWPGQHAAAGTGLHGGCRGPGLRALTSTVGRTVGLGTPRHCSSRCGCRSSFLVDFFF